MTLNFCGILYYYCCEFFNRNHPINMANNPSYVHLMNDFSGSQTQSDTHYESVTDH